MRPITKTCLALPFSEGPFPICRQARAVLALQPNTSTKNQRQNSVREEQTGSYDRPGETTPVKARADPDNSMTKERNLNISLSSGHSTVLH
jgi:hypothetical protein